MAHAPDHVVGEVFVRRGLLRRPVPVTFDLFSPEWIYAQVFRYQWAERQAMEEAWPSFEADGWSEYPNYDMDGEGKRYSPPLWLRRIRPTMSPDVFIAEFALAGNAYHAADGFLMAAGYIG